jgi:hypothetical protein
VYAQTEHARIGKQMLAMIPRDATVSAQGTIAPHLSSRETIYVFPTVREAEYVVLDTTANTFPVHLQLLPDRNPEQSYREYVRRLSDGDYALLSAADGWMLFRRKRPGAAAAP